MSKARQPNDWHRWPLLPLLSAGKSRERGLVTTIGLATAHTIEEFDKTYIVVQVPVTDADGSLTLLRHGYVILADGTGFWRSARTYSVDLAIKQANGSDVDLRMAHSIFLDFKETINRYDPEPIKVPRRDRDWHYVIVTLPSGEQKLACITSDQLASSIKIEENE